MSTPFDPNAAGNPNDPYGTGSTTGSTGQPAGSQNPYGQDPYAQGNYGQGDYGQPQSQQQGQPQYQQPGQPQYQQPGAQNYGQPGYGQPAYAPTYATSTPQVQDPGQVFGIIALVGAFVFSPVGIILGVIARKKSREAGLDDNALGKWGFILGIIFTALWVLFWIAYIVFFVVVIAATSSSSTYDTGFLLGAF